MKYLELAMKEITSGLQGFEIIVILRTENNQLDALSKLASSSLFDIERTS